MPSSSPPTDAYTHGAPSRTARARVASPCAPIAIRRHGRDGSPSRPRTPWKGVPTKLRATANAFATSPRLRGIKAIFAMSPFLPSSRSFALRFLTGPSNLCIERITFAPAACAASTSFFPPNPSSKSTYPKPISAHSAPLRLCDKFLPRLRVKTLSKNFTLSASFPLNAPPSHALRNVSTIGTFHGDDFASIFGNAATFARSLFFRRSTRSSTMSVK